MQLDDSGNECAVTCKCMGIRNTLRRLEKSGLGALAENSTFERFSTHHDWQKKMLDTVKAYVSDCNGNWLLLAGQVGCGKTMLCTAATRALIEHGKSARYMLWRDDVVSLKASVNDEAEYSRQIKPFKRTDVLYIDDFLKTQSGKQPTQGDINVAFEIISARYNDPQKATIISTEYLLPDLLYIDESVGSRIYQRTKNYCLEIRRDKKKNYRLFGQK